MFTGNIVFENGDSDTKLTFRGVSEKNSDEFILPVASTTTAIGVEEIPTAVLNNQNNRVHMYNNFEIHSNRSVINVDFDGSRTEGEWDPTCGHVALGGIGTSSSTLSGDGTIVKQGAGVLYLLYDDDSMVDGMGLTGTNTGYAWRIEEGRVRAVKQESLGKNAIYIDSQGALSLARYSDDQIINPKTIISEIKSETGLTANTFENAITSSDGQIIIASNGVIELKGKIDTIGDAGSLNLSFYKKSALVLSGENNAKNFNINFGGANGGEANYLVTDVSGLASDSINVKNTTAEDLKEFASFELVLNEASDTTYSGSLQGDMYLHKLGTGTITLSGNNTFTEGTYITEGGLLLATSNSIGTGNILFDSDTANSADYASIGVAEGGNIDLINNIHVKKGAILNVLEGQNMYLKGDLVRYDAREGYEAEFIKNGLGNAIISEIEGVDRKINISTFTVTEGGFILDKGVASDSYFSLDGQQAFLEVRENAEIKNNVIDINNGDLIIFNEKCISSATAVNFNNEIASSTDS
ncbi:MAG: hypothetical protein II598_00695, partial [Elusimicrobia bacterium]|nr:hypothetical protein [Elusimicrobiota bacterium]